ncbi:MAG: efflux RND transporter periplasmic adaptor subunit [Syntrophales bacterium]
MKKTIALTLLGLLIVVAALAGVKLLQFRTMDEAGKRAVPPPETVTTALARSATWETSLTAVGSLAAVQGVTVAAELPGKVVEIAFQPGKSVRKGDLLIRQDTTSEEAQIAGAVAQTKLTKTVLDRNRQLLPERIVSQADYDASVAGHEQAAAQADALRTLIAKKTIRAPFTGRLGIRQANLGQILREGDPIVTLQALDPIFVNFSLPQQQLALLHPGLPVRVTCDVLPGVTVEGRITAVNPLVDAETRNIQLQATLANRAEKLLPGMFVNVAVRLPVRTRVIAIPATSVLYAPYGDSVFVVTPTLPSPLKGEGIELPPAPSARKGKEPAPATGTGKEKEPTPATGAGKGKELPLSTGAGKGKEPPPSPSAGKGKEPPPAPSAGKGKEPPPSTGTGKEKEPTPAPSAGKGKEPPPSPLAGEGYREGGKVVRQQFIRLGEKRGDFVAVTDGLKEGAEVVSTGVFKLRTGQAVVVDNSKALQFQQSPAPENR